MRTTGHCSHCTPRTPCGSQFTRKGAKTASGSQAPSSYTQQVIAECLAKTRFLKNSQRPSLLNLIWNAVFSGIYMMSLGDAARWGSSETRVTLLAVGTSESHLLSSTPNPKAIRGLWSCSVHSCVSQCHPERPRKPQWHPRQPATWKFSCPPGWARALGEGSLSAPLWLLLSFSFTPGFASCLVSPALTQVPAPAPFHPQVPPRQNGDACGGLIQCFPSIPTCAIFL